MMDREDFNKHYPTNLTLIYTLLRHMTKQLTFASKLEPILKNRPQWPTYIRLFEDFKLGAVHLIEGDGYISEIIDPKSPESSSAANKLVKTPTSLTVGFSLGLFPPNYKPNEDDGE
jgi:hypothetical protein